jgi:hypothetical protein
MYQHYNGLDGNKPSVVVRNSRNSGGHFIQFNLGKLGVVRYRLECGYQPVDIDKYWPVPDKPDIPDNPTPPTPPTPQPSPDPTPEPTPQPTPEPTPTPESKDGNAGPQPQVPDNTPGKEDYGGSGNHDSLDEPTNEAVSPPEYNPPAPPQPETPEPSINEPPKTSDGQPDASAGTQSGSRIVDDTNGTTEDHGGQDYAVQADDGQNHTDAGEVQQQHSHDTVDEPVKADGENQRDPGESAVE